MGMIPDRKRTARDFFPSFLNPKPERKSYCQPLQNLGKNYKRELGLKEVEILDFFGTRKNFPLDTGLILS